MILGAFGYLYPIASKGAIFLGNASYDLPGKLGPFGGFKLYNDYSVLRKRVGNYRNSARNVTGMSFSAGKWVLYADFMLGKHHPYLSPDGGGLPLRPANMRDSRAGSTCTPATISEGAGQGLMMKRVVRPSRRNAARRQRGGHAVQTAKYAGKAPRHRHHIN